MIIGNVKLEEELTEDSIKVLNEIKYCASKMGIDASSLAEALYKYVKEDRN